MPFFKTKIKEELLMGKRYVLNKKEKNMSDELFKQVHKQLSYAEGKQAGSGLASYRTKLRAFCNFLAKDFQLRNLNNINNKHLSAFVKHRLELNVKDIQTELSAIRKFHSKLPNPRYKQLESNNSKLGLDPRRTIKNGKNIVNRAWSEEEFKRAVEIAKQSVNPKISEALRIARYSGMRLNEVTAMTRSQIREALECGNLNPTHSKGGLQRTIPVGEELYTVLRDVYIKSDRSDNRIFIQHGLSHKQIKKQINNFIQNHRSKWSEVDLENTQKVDNPNFRVRKELSFHGLRHSFAREEYQRNLSKG